MSNAFVFDLIDLDDVSVTREDDYLLVTCRGHDGADTIEIEDVHDTIAKHGYRVQATVGDFDAGEIQLEVVERGD